MNAKAIQPLAKPIKFSLAVPGSKSSLNRALICAALKPGKSTIKNPNYCDDVVYLITALQRLGVKIITEPNAIMVYGTGGKFIKPQRSLYLGNAGTATRFLLPLVPAGTTITGNAAMRQRPIQPLITALRDLGYSIDSPTGCPPVTVVDNRITNNHVTIDGSLSSQYISALLFLQSIQRRPFRLRVTGSQSSRPYITMTASIIEHFKTHNQYTVPADASSATYWWALAAITGSKITVTDVDFFSRQADIQFLKVLRRMGCRVEGATVIGPQQLKPITINMQSFPDAVMSLAIVAACAPGKTIITQVAHLRIKESDRLTLLVKNLQAIGITATATRSSLTIYGNPKKLKSGNIITDNDHRFAMAFAILGLKQSGICIDNPTCVRKSYPHFWQDLKSVQQQSKQQTILLTGMRGSGKSALGKILAKKYQARFIDFDQAIARNIHMPIADYVEKYGWKAFRNVEHDIVRRYRNVRNTIIATGGGTLMFTRNHRLFLHGYIILLNTPLAVLRQRLAKDKSVRPALRSDTIKEVSAIWRERKDTYLNVSDIIYDSRYFNQS